MNTRTHTPQLQCELFHARALVCYRLPGKLI